MLSTPPAFVLSQDQTLQKKQTKNSPSKKSQKNLTNTVLIKSENRKNTNKKHPKKGHQKTRKQKTKRYRDQNQQTHSPIHPSFHRDFNNRGVAHRKSAQQIKLYTSLSEDANLSPYLHIPGVSENNIPYMLAQIEPLALQHRLHQECWHAGQYSY